MDQEITTCPQCGATVQPPARFCVTCGIKLPDSQVNHNDGQPVDPRSGWNSAATSGWTTPPPGAFEFEDPTIIDVEPVSVTTEPPVSRWGSWPEQPERTEDEVESPTVEAASDEDTLIETTTPAPVIEEIAEAEVVTTTVAPLETSESVPEEPVGLSTVESEIETANNDASEELTAEITPVEAEPMAITIEAVEEAMDIEVPEAPEIGENAIDDFEPAGWTDEEDVAEEIAAAADENPVSSEPEGEVAGDESEVVAPGIERANALLDELRAILPGLAGGTAERTAEEAVEVAQEPAVDLDAIKAAAVEARGEISFDNFAALRATIDEATTKPRDVEVMLKLSQRVDDIVALIAERDRLQLGFDAVLERLENESAQ